MDRTGTPHKYWLLALLFSVYLLNHVAVASLGNKTPLEMAHGQQADTSALLAHHWWEPVYYAKNNAFPSTSGEGTGRWVGVAEHQGDALTYLILTDDTDQVIARSAVRSAKPGKNPNLRAYLSPDGGEINDKPILQSTDDLSGLHSDPSDLKLPLFTPEELVGRTFLRSTDDGQTFRAKVVRKIVDNDSANHQKIKFLLEIGEGDYDEIMAYNELSDLLERQNDEELNDPNRAWIYKGIIGHEGPLRQTDPRYKGSEYNVLVQWEDGTETYEPLTIMRKDDPVTCAKYAKDNGLLDTPGWKSLNRITKNQKTYTRMLNQTKMKSERNGPIYKFGVRVPRHRGEAHALDKANGNTLWQDAIATEMSQLDDYGTFRSLGKGAPVPKNYKRINIHCIFDVKHDLRHKARCVAGGHMTQVSKDSVYSGVVSLRSLRIAILAAELNGLDVMVGDVGNAYLEAFTKEKVCFIAGPEFGELEGHMMIIIKALYGLRSSGARYWERFADILRDMGFQPCRADGCVWMRDAGTHWEYVCTYVHDLLAAMKDPQAFFDELQGPKYKLKLKGVDAPSYHLGGDFSRDSDGTYAWGAKTYVKRLVTNYELMFGEKPKEWKSPAEHGDHPEVDASEFLDENGTRQYMSLLGALQWAISLCRFDIATAVMTLGRFRVAPRVGHMDRLKRICGYLRKYPDAAIRFRTGIPSYDDFEIPEHDWMYSVYGEASEEMPTGMPTPKGKPIRTSSFVDANLMHDLTTGRSATGIIHFLNQTPIDWFSKRQNTVETATFGSEFVAARQCTEQVYDLRYTLRMMGIPLDGTAYMFGDNQGVITQSTIPHSVLTKRHNALAYHRVREAVAAGVIYFLKIDGKQNVADCLTKFLSHSVLWPMIEPLLFWKGETIEPKTPA
jgi:hypothetical protein